MVLRYGNRMAVLWTTRRIVPPQQTQPVATPPSDLAQRMAVAPAPPPQPAARAPQSGTVQLANMTALYTDTVTDGRE
jgi:hypothetical protein